MSGRREGVPLQGGYAREPMVCGLDDPTEASHFTPLRLHEGSSSDPCCAEFAPFPARLLVLCSSVEGLFKRELG